MRSDSIIINSTEELTAAARWLDEKIAHSGRNVVAIYAQMGAGKTTFISAFAKYRQAVQTASSPTFSIINTYDTPSQTLFHFDLYRIDNDKQAQDLALDEYFYEPNSICLLEWPENIEKFLIPEITLKLEIEVMQDGARKFHVVQ